jgi:hypothetical protein
MLASQSYHRAGTSAERMRVLGFTLPPDADEWTVAPLAVESSADIWAEIHLKRHVLFHVLGGEPATASGKLKAISIAHDSACDREGRALDRFLALAEKFRPEVDWIERLRRSAPRRDAEAAHADPQPVTATTSDELTVNDPKADEPGHDSE